MPPRFEVFTCAVYNSCTYHESLPVPSYVGRAGRTHWVPRTPAVAAGIKDHLWSVSELPSYQVLLSRWTPPQHRSRLSQAVKELINKWI